MDCMNVGAVLEAQRHADKTQKAHAGRTDFICSLQKAAETDTSRLDAYRQQLEKRFGKVMIQNVGKDQRSMDTLGYGTSNDFQWCSHSSGWNSNVLPLRRRVTGNQGPGRGREQGKRREKSKAKKRKSIAELRGSKKAEAGFDGVSHK